ncbi:MAG: MoaD/ThiS family protein [Candidatus Sedimenticola sp. (ex Thyasira tokunagai)]
MKLLYFTYLVQKMRREAEEVELPPAVTDVASLVEWLQRRNRDIAHLFQDESVRVTVNKQFAEPFTRIESGDEVAFIPTSPVAPVAN